MWTLWGLPPEGMYARSAERSQERLLLLCQPRYRAHYFTFWALIPWISFEDLMKALSLKQPWANLILSGRKTIETRKWKTSYRGDLLICSSLQPDKNFAYNVNFLTGIHERPFGKAICLVELYDCKKMTIEHGMVMANLIIFQWILIGRECHPNQNWPKTNFYVKNLSF